MKYSRSNSGLYVPQRLAPRAKQRGMFAMGPGFFKSGVSVSDPYKAAVLADSPVIYWRLDETSGTVAADTSGNGNAGTYAEDVSLLTAAGLLTTSTDKGILLPSTAVGVTIANPINTSLNWSVEALIKPTVVPPTSGVGAIFMLGPSGGNPEIDIQDAGSGTFFFRVMRSGLSQIFRSTSTFAYGTRVHVVLTFASATGDLLLYENGVQDANTGSMAYGNAGGNILFGMANFGSNSYSCQGYADEAAVYSTTLSATRVAAHYAAS